MTTQLPELEPHCGSWIATRPDGRVFELFNRSYAELCASRGWKLETAAQYLGRINKAIREQN